MDPFDWHRSTITCRSRWGGGGHQGPPASSKIHDNLPFFSHRRKLNTFYWKKVCLHLHSNAQGNVILWVSGTLSNFLVSMPRRIRHRLSGFTNVGHRLEISWYCLYVLAKYQQCSRLTPGWDTLHHGAKALNSIFSIVVVVYINK